MSRSPLNQSESQSQSPSLSSIPDSIEPVIGWRVWIVGATDLALYSSYYPNKSGAWKGKMFAAMTSEIGLDAGFHAFKSKLSASNWGEVHCKQEAWMTAYSGKEKEVYQRLLLPDQTVRYSVYDYRIGQVVLWGNIVEYEDGYRAEFAMRRDEWERVENFT